MKIGYARVSTDDQKAALQLDALKKAGCKTIFKDEGLFGATVKRPALRHCLKKLEPGDTLIVWELDRLGRSLRGLIRAPIERLQCHRLQDSRRRARYGTQPSTISSSSGEIQRTASRIEGRYDTKEAQTLDGSPHGCTETEART